PEASIPDGVILEEYAPHKALFRRAAAVVNQAGAGTLHHGLRAGVPMLTVPYANDQPDNAYRVERLGVARTIRSERYKARRVMAELRLLLNESRFRERAAEVGALVRAEDGVAAACDAIERVLSVQTQSST